MNEGGLFYHAFQFLWIIRHNRDIAPIGAMFRVVCLKTNHVCMIRLERAIPMPDDNLVPREDFHPKGDGGSGRRPLPPDHLTFW